MITYEYPLNERIRTLLRLEDLFERSRHFIALTDPHDHHMALLTLFEILEVASRADLKSVARVLRKYRVTECVVGNPLYMSGDQSPQAAKAQAFAEELRTEFGITVHLWDERLTTTQAHRHLDDAGHGAMGRKGIIDQVAAVLILQSFLEARANLKASLKPAT